MVNDVENVLIVDVETTGLSPAKGAQLIEIGAILYNVKHKAILQQFSTLLPCESNPVEHINNINAVLTNCSYGRYEIAVLRELIRHCQAIVAHNAQFDRSFLNNEILSLHTDYQKLPEKQWICTKNNFKWPVPLNRFRLQDVCEAMGINYIGAHRALADCNFIAQCFSKLDDLQERIDTALLLAK